MFAYIYYNNDKALSYSRFGYFERYVLWNILRV